MEHQRVIVCGDVHGCAETLDELLRAVVHTRADRLIFVGDLVDRGPDPLGVCARVRELGALVVLGNHEKKHMRMAKRDAAAAAGGKPNVMHPFDPTRRAQHEALLARGDVAWFATWPTRVEFSWGANRWVVIHAGARVNQATPTTPGATGIVRDSALPGSTPAWDGSASIIYGHIVHSLSDPRIDMCREPWDNDVAALRHNDAMRALTYGIDTGAYFGGRLTAVVFTPGKPVPHFVQVDQPVAYATWHQPGDA